MGQAKRRGSFEQRQRLAVEGLRKEREAAGLARIEAEARRVDSEEPKRRAASRVLAIALGVALASSR